MSELPPAPAPARTVEVDLDDLTAVWRLAMAQMTRTYQEIATALAPMFARLSETLCDLAERYPALFDPPAPPDPFERAMQARRMRGTGPPPRPLDGRGRQ